jgi:hypothetical protein
MVAQSTDKENKALHYMQTEKWSTVAQKMCWELTSTHIQAST